MKNIHFLLILFAVSIFTCCGNTQKNSDEVQPEAFDVFLALFADVKLPFSSADYACGKTAIDAELCEQFIFSNGDYDTESMYPIGTFAIEDKFVGVIFCYSSGTSGDVKELFVYDKNGTFVSSLIIELEYRQFSQFGKINTSYEIELSSYTEDESIDYEHYVIKNGKIQAN